MRCWRLILVALAAGACALAGCNGASPAQPTASLGPLAAQGQRLFNQNCATCHSLASDTIIVGPSLAGVATRAGTRAPDLDARQYIEMSILKPNAHVVKGFSDLMPKDFGEKLTSEEFDALVAYLLTLK